MSETPASDEAIPEPVDVRNNPESRAGDADTSSYVARAGGDGGAPPREPLPAGDLPERVTEEESSPVAGVTISADDRDEAVTPDTDRPEQDGPVAGHV